ncbi:MAG: hypothetical protein IPM01_30900, partial [Burkholderiaceae bacterium]|nr:hypothetical protein [Burkholderiaceae bacterium]
MNPGKIVRTSRMDDARLFRFRPGHAGEAAAHRTRLVGLECAGRPGHGGHQRAGHRRAVRPGGFAKAVEMCNNNGHCRKFDAGTMCPSYRVTRN